MEKKRTISLEEVEKHNNEKSCWMVLFGQVYDLTRFLKEHPGGKRILLKNSGADGTGAFSSIHSRDVLMQLSPEEHIGELDPKDQTTQTFDPVKEWKEKRKNLPSLNMILNMFDFEVLAKEVMGAEGWAYYNSGALDEFAMRENRLAFNRVILRPRVLVDVSKIDMTTTILGYKSSFPLYITSAALGKLAHPEGETLLTKASHTMGVIQICATLSSSSLDEMVEVKAPDQPLFFQLYMNPDREKAKEMIQKAEKMGMKALCVTVDAPTLGRREKDMRFKASARPDVADDDSGANKSSGIARYISHFIDPSLNWSDIAWIRSVTSMPIVLKGVQTGEDAILAAQHGVKGIILSNHGGRQADTCRSGLEVLPEVMAALRSIGAEKKVEVWVDGGIRRGSDIFKAIALGAKAVGIGRPSLYAMATYGQKGVEKMLDLLMQELESCMVMMGTPSISDIKPSHVLATSLADHSAPPRDILFEGAYEPL
eukprot:CAMPEP_0201481564 /NCGR_PEP_ID=MMETSP0151_2-20130828/5836_1 /ASSEMBLY_ACC=CAM_ASM_000257 /TAXON_ID=200890 /ORGANISM="Paramoeba atlantica, Strain 621/1 / CCAP 1560/9" /LENGTH=482 /DNA_ID=CAMNT_0047863835 /DNA_START=72 /DNA_END=1517 /DNA_ORIENTATION=-